MKCILNVRIAVCCDICCEQQHFARLHVAIDPDTGETTLDKVEVDGCIKIYQDYPERVADMLKIGGLIHQRISNRERGCEDD